MQKARRSNCSKRGMSAAYCAQKDVDDVIRQHHEIPDDRQRRHQDTCSMTLFFELIMKPMILRYDVLLDLFVEDGSTRIHQHVALVAVHCFRLRRSRVLS